MNKLLSVVLAGALIFTVVGCGGAKTEGGKPAETKTPAITGTIFEGAYLTFKHSDDWRITEDTKWKTVRCEKGSLLSPTNYVLFKAEKESKRTAEEAVTAFADSYGGSAAIKTTYNNIEYFQTSFEYGGTPQTMMVTMVGDNKLTITLQGPGHDDEASIKNILNSLELNF